MFRDYTLLETNRVIRQLEDNIAHLGCASRCGFCTAALDKLGCYGLSKVEKTELISIYDLTAETKE